jgi:excisionase family DNA binding protein
MRVSTMTVYRLIKAGELPAIRVGKHFRIKHADLVAYLDSRMVGGPGAAGEVGELGDVAGAAGGPSAAERGGTSWPGA